MVGKEIAKVLQEMKDYDFKNNRQELRALMESDIGKIEIENTQNLK